MKNYIGASVGLCLGSVVSLMAAASAGWASDTTIVNTTVSGASVTNAPASASYMASSMNAAPSADNLRQGLPGRRLGGGTRSDRIFAGDYAYLTALVTSDNVSVTAAERPTLLFYVPEMLSANAVEFVLRDANDELVYDATFEVGAEGGVVRVDAAVAEMPALTRNENYSWYFSIVPDAADRAHDVAVHGSVRRVDPAEWLHQQAIDVALLDELPSLAPLEKVRVLHQQANMWHDAVLLLDAFHRAEPHNTAIAAEWSQLLESAGLVTVTSTSQASIQLGAN